MERTTRLRELFEQALALPADARAAFLEAQCADAALRAELERMLAADAGAGDLLDDGDAVAAAERIGDAAEPAPALPPGSRIGPFELTGVLGEGGSSTVFRAFREVDGVRQEVALKLLRCGLYAPEAQRQFRREQRALAQLKHPGIARLIEGGIGDGGLAYIALELVEGAPITVYADRHGLGLDARLALFARVCAAVQAAHRALIVHRDLKPSNVLVTAEGEVKLLDFGIAKLLEDEEQTQTLHAAFTPAYAAPEQRAGELATTATDVYALGVLLGELVTGRRLSGGRGDAPPPRLAPAPPQAGHRRLAGDLDNIVAMATDPEPERRYVSAGALAEDIERLRSGLPVLAHPPSRAYRARKFVARHRGGVAATALFLFCVLAALSLALWQADVARQQAARANTVRDFLVGLFNAAGAHLPREQRPTPEALVEQAGQRLAATALDAPTRADLSQTLGEVELSMAHYDRADALFAEAERAASSAGDARATRHARVARAEAAERLGRDAAALDALSPLLAALRAAPDADLLRALATQAAAQMNLGRPDSAVALRREAATAAARLYGDADAKALAARFDIGNDLAEAQRYRDAIDALQPALAAWRAARWPEDDRYVAALQNLATAVYGTGDLPGAEDRFRELLALERRIYRAPHDAIAATLRDLGDILVHEEKNDEGEALLRQALAMQREIFGDDHVETAKTHDALGYAAVARRHFDEAEAQFRRAIEICTRSAIADEVCTRARNNLGMAFYRQDRLDEAKAEMTQVLAERRKRFGDTHPTVAYSLSTLANVAVKQGDYPAAVRDSAEALAILDRAGMDDSRDVALVRNGYAQALWKANSNDEALRQIERAIADWQRVAPAGVSRHVAMLALKAQILRDLGRDAEAAEAAHSALGLGAPETELAPQTLSLLHELDDAAPVAR